MPTTIFLLLLAWSSPSPGITSAPSRTQAPSTTRPDDRPGRPAAFVVSAPGTDRGRPDRVGDIVDDRDDETDDDLAVLAAASPATGRSRPRPPRPMAPRPFRLARDRSPILRC